MEVFDQDEYDDGSGPLVEVWACPPPTMAQRYQVLQQRWSADFKVRTIHEWQPV